MTTVAQQWPFLIALAILVTPAVAGAQEEPPLGCFCLADADVPLPQVQRGCTREKFPNQFYWRAICRYVDATGQIVVAPSIMITEDWTILSPDHPDCAACEPAARVGPIVPRGDDPDEASE